jgi:heterotetrameric sarcosine oxidase gamma subunit
VAELGLLARSPIVPAAPETVSAGWVVSGRRSQAELTLTDQTPLAKVGVKARSEEAVAEALGVPLGRAVRDEWALGGSRSPVLVTGPAPGEWVALAATETQRALVDRLQALLAGVGDLVTVIDLTHGRATIRLTGRRAVDVLAKECAIDLADDMCPDGSALRTAVAGVSTDVARVDHAGVRSYLLHCERSSGQYLFDALLDAGEEYGIEVDGFTAPGL